MPIIFDNNNFLNNKTGVRAPSSSEVNFRDNTFKDNDFGVDIFFSKEDIIASGLPEDTNPEHIKEAISIIKNNADAPKDVQEYLLSNTELSKWLNNTASATTIASGLLSAITSLM